MMDSDKYLDRLFQQAQSDTTEMSFAEASSRFLEKVPPAGRWELWDFLGGNFFVVVGLCTAAIVWQYPKQEENLVPNETRLYSALGGDSLDLDGAEQVAKFAEPELPLFVEPKPGQSLPEGKWQHQRDGTHTSIPEQAGEPSLGSTILTPLDPRSQESLLAFQRQIPLEVKDKLPVVQSVRFLIDESSSTRTLARIASLAEDAGVDYTYVVDLKRKLIREFNVEMFIRGTDKATSIQVNVPTEGDFEIELGWDLNAQGRAVGLSEGVEVQLGKQKHPLRQTLARVLYRIYLDRGAEYIRSNFERLSVNYKPKRSKDLLLNSTGYFFLHENRVAEAIDIFTLNCQLFPGKPNPWDSLGEALYRAGRKQEALQAFQEALEIQPNLTSAKSWVGRILSEK